jgi:hypothetical protein
MALKERRIGHFKSISVAKLKYYHCFETIQAAHCTCTAGIEVGIPIGKIATGY